ncbi:MAG: hypothetical protein M3R00_05210, partial [Pseudomonadota bacterium]|nr:hypothetical protein [Pseudomonadota bacterium]
MEFKQEQHFTGTEISEYLQRIPIAELVTYDLRIAELIQRIKNDILRFVPKDKKDAFSRQFITSHFSNSKVKNDKRHFERALFETLRDEIAAAKKLLYDTALIPIFIGQDIPFRFAADEINEAYYKVMHKRNTIVAVGANEAERIMGRLLLADPQTYSIYKQNKTDGKDLLLAITPENITIVLDCIGYTIKPKNPEFRDLHRKLNRLRLSLTEDDHKLIFSKGKDAAEPFTINREYATALWGNAKNVLKHDQILSIWHALENDLPTRDKLFEPGDLQSNESIHLIHHKNLYLNLLNAASKSHHHTQLLASQSKELLSHLTLQQLLTLDKLRYNKGVDASRNVLTSGSQYLGTYSVNTGNIAPVLNILMNTAFNFSIYAAAIASLAFGSIVLGGAAALQQYYDNKYKEERFRLTHIIQSLAINRKHQDT